MLKILLPILLISAVSSSFEFFDSLYFYNVHNNCTVDEFACRNGHCIAMDKRCDNHTDCLLDDRSDEEDCDMYLCREPTFFRCKNLRCITAMFQCDGQNDCDDYSDEVNCTDTAVAAINQTENVTKTAICGKDEWQCTDKLCILLDWVCNGETDCLDGSDETIGCSIDIKCDGFKCTNGHCIMSEWHCDGTDDCRDNSDEINCNNNTIIISSSQPDYCTWDNQRFICADNKTCIKLSEVCDDHVHCPDRSDESPLCRAVNMSCKEHHCSHDCIQLPSGPRCVCPHGYRSINANHCEDINECDIYGICDQMCRNTPGSYECYCAPGYAFASDQKTCKANGGGQTTMLFSSKSEIRAYLLETELYFPIVKNLKQVVGVFFDGRHVYWTDIFSEHESIVRALEDGSQRELLVTSGLGAPEDLAIDMITGNIYFTDSERQHIGVCNSDGTHCTVLVNVEVHKPRGIVLDSAEGNMYWTDWGKIPEIARSLMDGSHDVSFVTNDIHWPNGLTIDRPGTRLYWTDAKLMRLESIRLDGTDRRIILEGVVKHPYAIAVFENRLYWSDWATHSIQACDKFTGKNHHTIIKSNKDYIYGISIYHSVLNDYKRTNPCIDAMCSDICLLNGATSYSCACPQNKELMYDRRTCRIIEKRQMLIVGAKNLLMQIEHQLLGKHDVVAMPVSVQNVGALAYNSVNNTVFISDLDVRKIILLNMHSGVSEMLNVQDLGRIIAMDYDYLGNNLYWCDEDKGTIEVLNLNTMSRKVLLHDMNGELPESIALIPSEGVMFVALKKANTRESHVDRFHMDGTGRTHSIEHGLLGPISLMYDSQLHRIFIADTLTGNIDITDVTGIERHGFRSLQTYPVSIASLKNDIFWVNEHSKRIYWADKLNAGKSYNKKITLDLAEDVERMQIVSITPRKIITNPCQFNNGNCSHLCLITQKTVVCACPVDMQLFDGEHHTCTKRLECNRDTEFFCSKSNVCIPKKMHCNNKIDCDHDEDELDCLKTTINDCGINQFQCHNGDCIATSLICNHHYDCIDKSDEHNCSSDLFHFVCPPFHFQCTNGQCIANQFICDGVNDCVSNEDESNCVSVTCDESQFRCMSGSCIPKTWECDHEYDCEDYSDEHSQCPFCPARMFTCSNGKCLDKIFLCNGADDCGDNSDEHSCQIAIKTGSCPPDHLPCTSNQTICIPLSARCNGTSECPHHDDEQNCTNCHVEEFQCTNQKCISTLWLCDHVDDCGDNSDESTDLCFHPSSSSLSRSSSLNDSIINHVVPCNENGFRCKTGHCIDLTDVCDGVPHCYDGSDEGGACNTSCDSLNNPCAHICVRTPVGPICRCQNGFRLQNDGQHCVDINECDVDSSICSQICINSIGSVLCDCFDGFILRADKKSCKAVGEVMSMLFTTSDNQIRELSQKENSLKLIHTEDTFEISGLDVAIASESIYYSIDTSGTIHRLNRHTNIHDYIGNVGRPEQLSIDWITENIYYINNRVRIGICNFNNMKRCANLMINIDTVHRQITAIVVDPVNRLLFYSLSSTWLFNSPTFAIYKCWLDGSNVTELIKNRPGYITGLTYDLNKKELYYCNQNDGEIRRINYDGTFNRLLIGNLTGHHPHGLILFENSLYFLTTLGHMSKCRLYDLFVCDTFKLNGLTTSEFFTISQQSRQPYYPNNTSILNVCHPNHTCSYLCVPNGDVKTNNYRCLCRNGMVINRNDKCSSIDVDSLSNNNNMNDEDMFSSLSITNTNTNISRPDNNNNSVNILIGILIVFGTFAFCLAVYYLIKKRRNYIGRNISVRFYNRPCDLHTVDVNEPVVRIIETKQTVTTKPLIPGQHEYTNPMNLFSNNDGMMKIKESISPRIVFKGMK